MSDTNNPQVSISNHQNGSANGTIPHSYDKLNDNVKTSISDVTNHSNDDPPVPLQVHSSPVLPTISNLTLSESSYVPSTASSNTRVPTATSPTSIQPSIPPHSRKPPTLSPARPAPAPMLNANARIASAPAVPNAAGLLRPDRVSTQNIPLPPSLKAKMAAIAQRKGSPAPSPSDLTSASPFPPTPLSGAPPTRLGVTGAGRPASGGLASRRKGPGLNLAGPQDRLGPNGPTSTPAIANRPGNSLRLNPPATGSNSLTSTPFANFGKIVDPSGKLNFAHKAVLHASGVDFSSGASFSINMGELTLLGEIGRGNYGTVQKVFHKVTKVVMAMKEIRLELDDSKLKAIITELDILHRATAPEIIDFYGAFFIESCVYYCMEFMDAGSLEQMGGGDVPEPVLVRVTASMVRGLKFLKDKLQIMHRDVKPTNVLVNRQGMIKLCDFGVSGQLERSLAKTNIGCQSYMAPERIKGESQGQVSTYTVSSDVWSLGLSIIEFTLGHYPYPPETYSNVFAQLQAIVHGDPPSLPPVYSKAAENFVDLCLQKIPARRPSYKEMLEHPFLINDQISNVDMINWIEKQLEFKASASSPSAKTSPSESR